MNPRKLLGAVLVVAGVSSFLATYAVQKSRNKVIELSQDEVKVERLNDDTSEQAR